MTLIARRRSAQHAPGLALLVSAFCAGSVAAQSAELRLIEELRLGRVDGSGPDVFANIDDLAVDA